MEKIAIIIFAIILSVIQVKSQVLNVSEVEQEQTQWCWVGVTACALDYYCHPTLQCDIAEYTRTVATWHYFGNTDCCVDPNLGCNYWNYNWGYPGSIQDILVHFANISNYGVGSSLTQSSITADILLNRVFIIRWGWAAGGGHFLVGHGLIGNNLYYMDPWFGEGLKIADYSWVCSGSNHTWTHTNRLSVSPSSDPPAAAGTISGPTTVCQGQNSVTYTVPAISNASSYIWTLPNGATGSSTTNSISVNYGTSATSGNITVHGTNSCGDGATSTLAITVNALPAAAGTISGPTTVCQGQNSVTYTVPAISNASSYIWTLPNGATGSSTTNTISANYGTSATSGNITVHGTNSCGDGATSTLVILVNDKPSTPTISLIGNVLHSDATLGNQWYDQNGLINGATNQDYTATANGDYYVIVTLLECSSEPSNTITVIVTTIEVVEHGRITKVYPNPVSDKLIIEIEGGKEMINFEIFNTIGQVVSKGNLVEKTTVQTNHFAPGVYLVKLENGITFEFKKIVKE